MQGNLYSAAFCSDGSGAGPLIVGTAMDVASTVGGVVSVLVAPTDMVVDLAIASGPACSWPIAMLSAPIATMALPPITADSIFTFLRFFSFIWQVTCHHWKICR
jgi:hypothetical protein